MKHTECRESKQCSPAKHHFDHCVERVNAQEAEGGAKEDCVEECMWPATPAPSPLRALPVRLANPVK